MRIFFDLDGTLFETAPHYLHTIAHLAELLGAPMPENTFALRQLGRPIEDILLTLFPESDPEKLVLDFDRVEAESIRSSGKLYEGAQELLEDLACQGHELCLCSNGSVHYIDLVLEKTGSAKFFSQVISAKGYPSRGWAVATHANGADRCLLVGDTGGDMSAAAMNSFPLLAALYGYGDRREFEDAMFFSENVGQLGSLIERVDALWTVSELLAEKRVILFAGTGEAREAAARDYARLLACRNVPVALLAVGEDRGEDPQALAKEIVEPFLGQNSLDVDSGPTRVGFSSQTIVIVQGERAFEISGFLGLGTHACGRVLVKAGENPHETQDTCEGQDYRKDKLVILDYGGDVSVRACGP